MGFNYTAFVVTLKAKFIYYMYFFRNENDIYLKQLKLVLIDEVHILNEKRGSCLEVIISR